MQDYSLPAPKSQPTGSSDVNTLKNLTYFNKTRTRRTFYLGKKKLTFFLLHKILNGIKISSHLALLSPVYSFTTLASSPLTGIYSPAIILIRHRHYYQIDKTKKIATCSFKLKLVLGKRNSASTHSAHFHEKKKEKKKQFKDIIFTP